MKTFIKTLRTSVLATAMAACILAGSWYAGTKLAGSGEQCLIAHPARLALFLISLVGFFIAPFLFRGMKNVFSKGNERKRDIIVPVCTLLGLVIAVASPLTDAAGFWRLPGGDALRWIGLALYSLGFVFMIWGPAHLGKQFSVHVTVQDEHELITSGPYSLMRHPRYAGCIYWAVGMPLAFLSLPGLLLAVPYTALLVWRMYDEEKLLSKHFAERWKTYSVITKRLVPYIY